nr:nucleotidyltransferase [Bacteroidota bacterium]
MDILFKPHRELLFLLLDFNVEFIVIGGYSVIYYGYTRGTNDMDLWLEPDNNNKDKLIQALTKYGIRSSDLEKMNTFDFTKTNMFFIGKDPFRIDFLTKVQGVKWEDAIENVVKLEFNNHHIPIVSFDDLIKMKITSERLKDKADVEELQKISKFRKEE